MSRSTKYRHPPVLSWLAFILGDMVEQRNSSKAYSGTGDVVGLDGREPLDESEAIRQYPRRNARTLRFRAGAPRSATVVGDGGLALFLRSDGPVDLATSLWLSVIDADDGAHGSRICGDAGREVKLADPRDLLANADSEDVPPEERARRERMREGGAGIVSYCVDAMGRRVAFTLDSKLFLTDVSAAVKASDGGEVRRATREVAAEALSDPQWRPVLNPHISPDGSHIAYSTGSRLVLVDVGDDAVEGADGDAVHEVARIAAGADPRTHRIGLAEFVAGEEMDRYDGFWWAPDSSEILFESFDSSDEPTWYISDPSEPEHGAESRRYPRALTGNAKVTLSLAALDFSESGEYRGCEIRQVQWDESAYEYLASLSWTDGHRPVMLVQNRRQNHDQVLSIEPDGTTSLMQEHENPQWLDLFPGVPALTPDGRLVCAINDMDANTNRLTIDGRPFTPTGWQVRSVLDVNDENVLVVVQRTPELADAAAVAGEPNAALPSEWLDKNDSETGQTHDARSMDVVTIAYDGSLTPVNQEPGDWSASRTGQGIVLMGRGMSEERGLMVHAFVVHEWVEDVRHPAATEESSACRVDDGPGESQRAGEFAQDVFTRVSGYASSLLHSIANYAEVPGFMPNTSFVRLGERRMYVAITRPSVSSKWAHAEKLPVLLKPYGGPGAQQVQLNRAFYSESQWWADQGFLVVTADNRGTPGRGPLWDREMFEDLKHASLDDQVEVVRALPQVAPDADLEHVAMIGWSFGGYLSALAVLDAPDVIHAACAGAPPTDWTLYDTHYTERYLGLDPKVYERNSIVADAPKLRRPLMLIHGFADDNVTIAHSLRLSQALMASGRPHTYLPLVGITHMTNDETVAQNLLTLQRDFLYDALGIC